MPGRIYFCPSGIIFYVRLNDIGFLVNEIHFLVNEIHFLVNNIHLLEENKTFNIMKFEIILCFENQNNNTLKLKIIY